MPPHDDHERAKGPGEWDRRMMALYPDWLDRRAASRSWWDLHYPPVSRGTSPSPEASTPPPSTR